METVTTQSEMTDRIVAKALSHGASLVGVASVAELKQSPSNVLAPRMAQNTGVGSRAVAEGVKPGEVAWPTNARSAVVIAVEHGEAEPELDWWYGKKSPPGNRVLMRINRSLSSWVRDTLNIAVHEMPYHVEKGGIFLKDAAVMAGLGCIGRNNILVTPAYGPRIRLRALLLETEIAPTGPVDFDPCGDCDAPCRHECPQNAFDRPIFSARDTELNQLPGRDGTYSRATCNHQMRVDIDAASEDIDPESGRMEKIIKYCRRCELACPVGTQMPHRR